MTDHLTPRQELAHSLRSLILFTPFAAMILAAYLGVGEALCGMSIDRVQTAMAVSAATVLAGGIIYAGLYALVRPRGRTPSPIHWRMIVASADLGLLIGVLGFALLPSPLVDAVIRPQIPLTAGRRLLIGALYGLLYGAAIGAVIDLLDGKAAHWTQEGLRRYIPLFLVAMAVLSLWVALETIEQIETWAPLISFALLGTAKIAQWGIEIWARRLPPPARLILWGVLVLVLLVVCAASTTFSLRAIAGATH